MFGCGTAKSEEKCSESRVHVLNLVLGHNPHTHERPPPPLPRTLTPRKYTPDTYTLVTYHQTLTPGTYMPPEQIPLCTNKANKTFLTERMSFTLLLFIFFNSYLFHCFFLHHIIFIWKIQNRMKRKNTDMVV